MPNMFQLTRKGEAEPATLTSVDEAICAHLNEPVHPRMYVRQWFDVVGFRLATGQTFDGMLDDWADDGDHPWPEMYEIAEFLNKHYTSSAWASRSK